MNLAVSRRRMLQLALSPAVVAGAQFSDIPPTVSRIYPGSDGKLVYVPDEQGNTIPDFSHAGYGGGGTPIPTVPVKETVWPLAGDNAANLQAAIDKVSALPVDKSGFRGAVLAKMGHYKMATPVRIQASGVVLRGEGMGDTGTILRSNEQLDAAQREQILAAVRERKRRPGTADKPVFLWGGAEVVPIAEALVRAEAEWQGRQFWVSRPIVYAIMKKYPTLVQIVMGA